MFHFVRFFSVILHFGKAEKFVKKAKRAKNMIFTWVNAVHQLRAKSPKKGSWVGAGAKKSRREFANYRPTSFLIARGTTFCMVYKIAWCKKVASFLFSPCLNPRAKCQDFKVDFQVDVENCFPMATPSVLFWKSDAQYRNLPLSFFLCSVKIIEYQYYNVSFTKISYINFNHFPPTRVAWQNSHQAFYSLITDASVA